MITIIDKMQKIGLSKTEIKILLFLRENNPSKVCEISSGTGLHRSNIYDTFRELIIKGFVYEVKKPQSFFYLADISCFDRNLDRLNQYFKDVFEFLSINHESKISVEKRELEIVYLFLKTNYPRIYDKCLKINKIKKHDTL